MAYGLMSNLMRGVRPARTRTGDSRLSEVPAPRQPGDVMVAPRPQGPLAKIYAALRKRRQKRD